MQPDEYSDSFFKSGICETKGRYADGHLGCIRNQEKKLNQMSKKSQYQIFFFEWFTPHGHPF